MKGCLPIFSSIRSSFLARFAGEHAELLHNELYQDYDRNIFLE